ncbi:MAG: rhodanese-like domain-containing protein [Candidatus Thorarchaeota archaeon]
MQRILEFDGGRLEGAVNIPVNELQQRVDELDSEDEMLVYCRTGNRSSSAVQILVDNGFTKIYHMVDGITAWTDAGYPVTSD